MGLVMACFYLLEIHVTIKAAYGFIPNVTACIYNLHLAVSFYLGSMSFMLL